MGGNCLGEGVEGGACVGVGRVWQKKLVVEELRTKDRQEWRSDIWIGGRSRIK